jgi:hypothetical protein
MTPDDVRVLALALPETTEQPHFERTSFRVAGKIFATMLPDGQTVNVLLGEEDARAAAEATDGVELLWWGRRLSGVRAELGEIDPDVLAELLEEAWYRRAPRTITAARDAAQRAPDAER